MKKTGRFKGDSVSTYKHSSIYGVPMKSENLNNPRISQGLDYDADENNDYQSSLGPRSSTLQKSSFKP